jgi:chromosome segregation ATPase
MTRSPDLGRFRTELDEIESNYVQYLGLTHALRLSQPRFMEQFRRMLVSKLRVVFENASAELELWNKATSSQVDSQLRERRRNFRRRRESLERVQSAASDLEARIAELEAQDERLQGLARRVHERFDALRDQARAGPVAGNDLISLELPAARAQA